MHIRSCIAVLLGAATALVVVVCLPAAANTLGDNISLISAGPTSGNSDLLTVTADDANDLPIATLSVDFCPVSASPCDDQDAVVPTMDMQVESQSDTSDQTFELTIPAGTGPGELPLGTYSMAFDATDADESDPALTAPDQADLAFIYTSVTVTATSTPISYNSSVTISGQVTGVLPGASQPSGIDSVPVVLDDLSTGVTTQVADTTSGAFSAQVTLAPTNQYDVEVLESQSYGSASVSLSTSVDEDATSVSAQVTPEDFTYGSKVKATLTGTAYYQSNGKHPLEDYPVQVTVGDTETTLTTNSSGQFSMTYPPSEGTSWSVLVGDGILLAKSEANGSIHVAVPLSFQSFSAKWAPLNSITLSGCVDVTVPGFTAPGGIVEVQYSKGRYGPWKPLAEAWLTPAGGPSCRGDDQSYFTVNEQTPPSNAYYRAYIPGSVNYLSAISHSLYRWKDITRIYQLHAAPLKIAKNGKITLSGQLLVWLNGAFRDYGKQTVGIVTYLRGATAWRWLKSIKTSANGDFKGTTKGLYGSWSNGALVSAYYLGNGTHFASTGVTFCIRLTGAPNLCNKRDDLNAPAILPVRSPA